MLVLPQPGMRVLVVDDDSVYRHLVAKLLLSLPGVEDVRTARNLAGAMEVLVQTPVDLVTLDVVLADESGLQLLRWMRGQGILAHVVLLTAGQSHEAQSEIDAVLVGAATLVRKPEGPHGPMELAGALAEVVAGARRRRLLATRSAVGVFSEQPRAPREVIVVGAGMGGPPALQLLVAQLALEVTTPLVAVLELPDGHLPFFVEHLRPLTPGRAIDIVSDGTLLAPGHVYVGGAGCLVTLARESGGDVALRVRPRHVALLVRAPVDALFCSAAEVCGATAVGVVLSGASGDGVLGATQLHALGAPVVAQDPSSSAAWGMPGAVVAVGAVDAVVPADRLADRLSAWIAPAPAALRPASAG